MPLRVGLPVFPSETHRRVHERLSRLVSAGAAAYFADACDIAMDAKSLRAATHLVGHLTRELEAIVRTVLLAGINAAQEEQRADAEEAQSPTPKAKKGGDGDNHRVEVVTILTALGLADDTAAAAWLTYVGRDSGKGWSRAAHRDDIRMPRELTPEFLTQWFEFVNVLDAVLDGFERQYGNALKALETLKSASTPSRTQIDSALKLLAPGTVTSNYFFDGASPGWLLPLRDAGFFASPPPDREGDGTDRPAQWPAGWYLARTAREQSTVVADIILHVPATDNPSVHAAYLTAATAMQLSDASRIVASELAWIRRQTKLDVLIADLCTKLVPALSQGGEVATAVQLLDAIVGPEAFIASGGAPPRLDSWQFDQLVTSGYRAIADRDPDVACKSVLAVLQSGVDAGERSHARAIEEGTTPHRPHDRFDTLVEVARDVLRLRVARDPAALESTVRELESRGDPVFERLALDLIRTAASAPRPLVLERLSDPERLGNWHVFHELAQLAADCFGRLSDDEKETVIDRWRKYARTRAEAAADYAEAEGREIGREGVERRYRSYLHSWLAVLPSVPPFAEKEWQELASELGRPENPTFVASVTWRTGPNPPVRVDDLAKLSDEQLRHYLRTWQPANRDPFEPSREGLARELKVLVKRDAGRFLAPEIVAGVPPRYIASIVEAIQEVIESKSPILQSRGEDILRMAETVAAEETRGDIDDEDEDQNWNEAHRAVVYLVSSITRRFGDDVAPVAERLWRVIRKLLASPDPTTARAGRYSDGEALSINCVRGSALHTAYELASRLGDESRVVRDEILERAVAMSDPTHERVEAIRHVNAQRFLVVAFARPDLARELGGRLFPDDQHAGEERHRAWATFLRWNGARVCAFEVVEDSYRYAAEHAGGRTEEEAGTLGEHLLGLVLAGAIAADDDSILAAYVRSASSSARHRALEALGRWLHGNDPNEESEHLHRIQALWEWWRGVVTTTSDARDLAAFGWWFSGKGLPPEWALSELGAAMKGTDGALDWDHAVAERLSELAAHFPDVVTQRLREFIDSADEWRVPRCHKGIRATLSSLQNTGEADAARSIASRLVARGYAQFRDLT